MNSLIKGAGFTKRSGVEVTEAVFILLRWKWLNRSSIAMFSRNALGTFSMARKDVMYDLLKREEINWRALNSQTAKAVYQQNKLTGRRVKAFVLDDSIKTRCSKKMEGVSSHFDHVTGRHVMGQQVLTLGLATEEAFLPLDSQIYISQVKARELINPYKDDRSVAGKRYSEATSQSKPEKASHMMKRAIRSGMEVYFKEAKQHLGFLQEQTATFASHTASVHLSAIRYLMLVHHKLEDPDSRVGDIRSQIQEQLDSLSFAGRLWQIFRTIISGTLSELQATLGCSVDTVMLSIDKRVSEFFIRSFQLDTFTIQLKYE
ncbi:MAG: transposase [Candidatus Thiodiazotropha sp. (ex Lucinoma kastoroae)]|nr:transposase [Candidatus Thiodiazotropha sp. (ex Lucinoma kastoroae)]